MKIGRLTGITFVSCDQATRCLKAKRKAKMGTQKTRIIFKQIIV